MIVSIVWRVSGFAKKLRSLCTSAQNRSMCARTVCCNSPVVRSVCEPLPVLALAAGANGLACAESTWAVGAESGDAHGAARGLVAKKGTK